MRTRTLIGILAMGIVVLLAPSVHAAGPVDGEVTALYWVSETELNAPAGTITEDSEAAGARAELWFAKKIGVSAAFYKPRPSGSLEDTDIDIASFDAKWRFLSPTEKTFGAIGVGWQTIDFGGAEGGDTSGYRLVAEGRVGLVGILYFYGRGGWAPSLEDFDRGGIRYADGEGTDLEVGLQLKPFAFVQFFLGYRADKTEFSTASGKATWKNKGPVLGAGFNF